MTVNASQIAAGPERLPKLTLWGAIRGEWVKLVSLRSNWVIGALLFVLSAGVPILLISLLTAFSDDTRVETVEVVTVAQPLSLVLGAVLGILSVGGEFSTGAVRASVVAVPRRGLCVAAKALVVAVSVGVVSLLGILVATFGVTFIAASSAWQLTAGKDALSRLALAILSVILFTLCALGVTLLVRSSAGAITIVAVVMFVLPVVLAIVGSILQTNWPTTVSTYLPSSAASLMVNWSTDPTQPSWWGATLALVLWAAVPMAAGTLLFQRRDL